MKLESNSLRETFAVEKGNFATAGEASGKIKRTLKQLGVDSQVVRRVAVVSYEVELNLVIHSDGGQLEMIITEGELQIIASDQGPGIPDVDLAMQEGYSTASDDVRSMGFGAGMGLPNMRRNADTFSITSTMGVGTKITMGFSL